VAGWDLLIYPTPDYSFITLNTAKGYANATYQKLAGRSRSQAVSVTNHEGVV
jgi:hypothetical protein